MSYNKVIINPNNASQASFRKLSTQWSNNLSNQLQSAGIDVRVSTLGVSGVRAMDEYPMLNTLGIEVEGADARKNTQRILHYITEYFKRNPVARVRNTGGPGADMLAKHMYFNHPVTKERMFPITHLVVKV